MTSKFNSKFESHDISQVAYVPIVNHKSESIGLFLLFLSRARHVDRTQTQTIIGICGMKKILCIKHLA